MMCLLMQGSGGFGNYFVEDVVVWGSVVLMVVDVSILGWYKIMVQCFLVDDFIIDLMGCDGLCFGLVWEDEFVDVVSMLWSVNSGFDGVGLCFFEVLGEMFYKLLILLGDVWWVGVSFLMDKDIIDIVIFLWFYFSDYVILFVWKNNFVQVDLGNFFCSDFFYIIFGNVLLIQESKFLFWILMVYVLLGQIFEVMCIDVGDVLVWIRVNSLCFGFIQVLDSGGYVWLKYFQFFKVFIVFGQIFLLILFYGGLIYVVYDFMGVDVVLSFDGVGFYFVWMSSVDDVIFVVELIVGEYDWVEFVIFYFEIYFIYEKMVKIMGNSFVFIGIVFEVLI